jgi:hypothetical protein
MKLFKTKFTKLIITLVTIILISQITNLIPIKAIDNNDFSEKILSPETIKRAVETWLIHYAPEKPVNPDVEKIEPYIIGDQTVAYIAHLKDCGYCLCGPSKLVKPVYFYCPKGKYSPDNPNTQYILEEIQEKVKIFTKWEDENNPELKQYQKIFSERAELWEGLIKGDVSMGKDDIVTQSTGPDIILLPLTCKWRQGSCKELEGLATFNKFCPYLTNVNERTYVGCPATAISQILYYWKWPTQGEGSDTMRYTFYYRLNWESSNLDFNPFEIANKNPEVWPWLNRLKYEDGKLHINGYWDKSMKNFASDLLEDTTATQDEKNAFQDAIEECFNFLIEDERTEVIHFNQETYNWDIMTDTWDEADSDGQDEIAKLCYHVGVAAGIVEDSEFKPFSYGIKGSGCGFENSRDVFVTHFKYYDYAEWIDSADYDTDNYLDIIRTEIQFLRPVLYFSPGHQWVVYGYNKSTDMFVMNMGWAGKYDGGWYAFDDAPELKKPQMPRHVSYIAPINTKFVEAGSGSGDGTPINPWKNLNEAISEADDYDTIIFKAGERYNIKSKSRAKDKEYRSLSNSNGFVIDKPLTLKGYDVVIGPISSSSNNKDNSNNLISLVEKFFELHPRLFPVLRHLFQKMLDF